MNRKNRIFWRGTDWPLFFCCGIAAVYGLFLVYSASASGAGGNPVMQATCLVLGLMAALTLSTVDYRTLARHWYVPAIPTLVLMALTFTPLGYEVPGTDDRNWLMLSLGSQRFLLQPSELLKIVFIVTFSYHLAAVGASIRKPLPLLGLLAHAAVPTLLIFAQGDDGNAVICLCLVLALLVAGGIPWWYLLGGSVPVGAAVPFVWRHMTPDKQARFLCLIEVENYKNTTGWQQELSVTAIGSGGWRGVGYLQGGTDNLYARQNDFIFTVAGEEFGFIGAVGVLGILTVILLCLYRAARRAADRTGQLICTGMLALLASHAVINIGMALRLMPVLGITLPFFSAGGSSLLTVFCGVGIAMSVTRYRR